MATRQFSRVGVARRVAPIRPGAPDLDQGGIVPPNVVNQDPYLYPPPGSKAINLNAAQAIVGVGASFSPAALSQALPTGSVGVIDSIDLQLDNIVLASNVIWRILVTGSPATGWSITVPGITGAAAAIKSWTKARIEIPLNGSIGVQIIDVDGGAYTATTTLYGWFWPVQR